MAFQREMDSSEKMRKIQDILLKKPDHKTHTKTNGGASMANNISSELSKRRNDFDEKDHRREENGSKSMGFGKIMEHSKKEITPVASKVYNKYTVRNSFGGAYVPRNNDEVNSFGN